MATNKIRYYEMAPGYAIPCEVVGKRQLKWWHFGKDTHILLKPKKGKVSLIWGRERKMSIEPKSEPHYTKKSEVIFWPLSRVCVDCELHCFMSSSDSKQPSYVCFVEGRKPKKDGTCKFHIPYSNMEYKKGR